MQIQYLPGHGGGEEGSEYRIEIKWIDISKPSPWFLSLLFVAVNNR